MRKDVWRDKWKKGELLSDEGGHGRTYYATRIDAGDANQPHVLKDLKHQRDPERRRRMYQEVANLQVLEHPGIARCVDSNAQRFNEDEELYLVTEYIPGGSLQDFVKAAPVPLEVAITIAKRLLEILEYCHGRNVIHRDIKPDNIILRNSDPSDAVLIDFGLSFNEDTQPEDFSTPRSLPFGNRFYYLPEYRLADGHKRDPISDITLIVAVFFYLLTATEPGPPLDDHGNPPHRRPGSVAALGRLGQSAGATVSRIFEVGFASERVKRWQSIQTLRRELDAVTVPPSPQVPSFEDQLRDLRQRFVETPTHLIAAKVGELQDVLKAQFAATQSATSAAFKDVFRSGGVGSLNSRGSSGGRIWVVTFEHMFLKELKLNLMMQGVANEGEFVVMGDQKSPPEREAFRVGLFDPQAYDLVRDGVQRFFREQLASIMR